MTRFVDCLSRRAAVTVALPATLLLCSCAAALHGITQDIHVVTNPEGASCIFEREGRTVASVPRTPGSAKVRRTKYDLIIKCNKEGFWEAAFLDHSGTSENVAFDYVAGPFGLIAAGIDSAEGADNAYDTPVHITLNPMSR